MLRLARLQLRRVVPAAEPARFEEMSNEVQQHQRELASAQRERRVLIENFLQPTACKGMVWAFPFLSEVFADRLVREVRGRGAASAGSKTHARLPGAAAAARSARRAG